MPHGLLRQPALYFDVLLDFELLQCIGIRGLVAVEDAIRVERS
jgi:hypothetical protein